MREYSKILDRNQLRNAVKRYYNNNPESKQYVLETVEGCITRNLVGINNVSICISGGHFNFEYIGRKKFKCNTTFPELLEVR